MDKRKKTNILHEPQENENKDALEKSNYNLIKNLKSDKTSLEKSKIGLFLTK